MNVNVIRCRFLYLLIKQVLKHIIPISIRNILLSLQVVLKNITTSSNSSKSTEKSTIFQRVMYKNEIKYQYKSHFSVLIASVIYIPNQLHDFFAYVSTLFFKILYRPPYPIVLSYAAMRSVAFCAILVSLSHTPFSNLSFNQVLKHSFQIPSRKVVTWAQ